MQINGSKYNHWTFIYMQKYATFTVNVFPCTSNQYYFCKSLKLYGIKK